MTNALSFVCTAVFMTLLAVSVKPYISLVPIPDSGKPRRKRKKQCSGSFRGVTRVGVTRGHICGVSPP